ncbi:MAG: hypothetical protein R3282_07370, partial [Rhodothermales bacterium]|nr:hypothetical protein [Rhodothermales bacterium]
MKCSAQRLACLLTSAQHLSACGSPERTSETSYRNNRADDEYVGDDACFDCHEDLYSRYQSHGMARSFYAYGDDLHGPEPVDTSLVHSSTGLTYTVIGRGDSLVQIERTSVGSELRLLTRRADYVVGSGNAAKTYLSETNGRLFELPITWYASGS